MNYIVTKPAKSKGIAILLVAFLGPIGMFYSTITGGLVMTLLVPATIVLLYLSGVAYHTGMLIIVALLLAVISYIISFIWAVSAVNKYNYKIEKDAYQLNHSSSSDYQSEFEKAFPTNQSNDAYKSWLIIVLLIALIGTWWFYFYAPKNDVLQETTIEPNSPDTSKQNTIASSSFSIKEQKIEKKVDSFYLKQILYTGSWHNQDLAFDGYTYELNLKEQNLLVSGNLDRYTLKGHVKEAYEEDDLLRRELVADMYDEMNRKVAQVSFDLSGEYTDNWNKQVTMAVKRKFVDLSILDAFNGASFAIAK